MRSFKYSKQDLLRQLITHVALCGVLGVLTGAALLQSPPQWPLHQASLDPQR